MSVATKRLSIATSDRAGVVLSAVRPSELAADLPFAADYPRNVTSDGGPPAPYPPAGGAFTAPPGQSVPHPPAYPSGSGRRAGKWCRDRAWNCGGRGGGCRVGRSSYPGRRILSASYTNHTAIDFGDTRPATDTTDADKALCEAIAPLMKESSEERTLSWRWGGRDAGARNGIPDFAKKTQDWVHRAQKVLDDHAEPPRFLTRTLQRYIDDMRMLASNLRPGLAFQRNGWLERQRIRLSWADRGMREVGIHFGSGRYWTRDADTTVLAGDPWRTLAGDRCRRLVRCRSYIAQ